MFLTVHTASGLLIGSNIKNSILAFIVAFIAHYIFDIIPHGDTKVDNKYRNPIHIATAGLIDIIIVYCYLLYMLLNGFDLFRLNVISAVIGSLLPDFLQGLYYIKRTKLLKKFKVLHDNIHNYISRQYEFNLVTGIIFQIIIFILFSLIILKII